MKNFARRHECERCKCILLSRYRKVAASSLVISNVQEIDDGSYQCRAENEVETLDAAADLIIQGIFFSAK